MADAQLTASLYRRLADLEETENSEDDEIEMPRAQVRGVCLLAHLSQIYRIICVCLESLSSGRWVSRLLLLLLLLPRLPFPHHL